MSLGFPLNLTLPARCTWDSYPHKWRLLTTFLAAQNRPSAALQLDFTSAPRIFSNLRAQSKCSVAIFGMIHCKRTAVAAPTFAASAAPATRCIAAT